jgi:cupin 2 domain-containing protein
LSQRLQEGNLKVLKTSNIFSDIPATLSGEIIEKIVTTDTLKVERIISKGHVSPKDFWYDQANAEWVIVLQGHAKLRFKENDEVIELFPGDYLDIPPHVHHRVEWTDPDQETIWLAVHY